jgi:hypothetical protein
MTYAQKYLKLSLEQINLEIEEVLDNQPETKTDELLMKVKAQSELDKNDDNSDIEQAQELSDDIDKAQDVAASLERLAESIEFSIKLGGLTATKADLVNFAHEAIAYDLGIETKAVAVENFDYISKRLSYSQESLNSVKNTIVKIWQMIIAGMKKLIEFVQRAIRFYRSDLFAHKEELQKLREIHRNIGKVNPNESSIESSVTGVLLIDTNNNTSQDVIRDGIKTNNIITDFLLSYRKDMATALMAIENFKNEVFDIPLDPDKEVTKFNKEDIVKYGQIFGVHIQGRLKQVDNLPGIIRPSNTIMAMASDVVAGNFKFAAFIPNKANLVAEDIISGARLRFLPDPESGGDKYEIEVCEINDFRKIFDLTDKMLVLSEKCYAETERMEREVAKLLKVVQASQSDIAKHLDKRFAEIKVDTNYRAATPVFSNLTTSVKRFYSEPMISLLKYTARYVKGLNFYARKSLESYA